MKKQKIQMIVILVLLVLCAGGYFFVTHHDLSGEEEEVDVATLRLTEAEADSINKITYYYEGKLLSFIKEDDTWYYEDDKSIELSQTDVSNLASYICSVSPNSVIDDPSELSEYGLENPANTITFYTEDGDSQTIYIGDYFEMEGDYFAKAEGDDTIYTISSYYATTFTKSLEELTASEETETEEE